MRRIQRKEREWAGKDTGREYRWEKVGKGTNIKGKRGKEMREGQARRNVRDGRFAVKGKRRRVEWERKGEGRGEEGDGICGKR